MSAREVRPCDAPASATSGDAQGTLRATAAGRHSSHVAFAALPEDATLRAWQAARRLASRCASRSQSTDRFFTQALTDA